MPRSRRRLLAALAGSSTLALAGCTESTGDEDTTDTPTEGEMESTPTNTSGGMETTASPTATEGGEMTATPTESEPVVRIPGFEYDPLRLSVEPGTTVEWVNESSTGHDVVSATFHDKAADWSFESDTFGGNESITYTFQEEGVYEYYCSIHGQSSMSGAILVGDVSLDQQLPSESSGGY